MCVCVWIEHWRKRGNRKEAVGVRAGGIGCVKLSAQDGYGQGRYTYGRVSVSVCLCACCKRGPTVYTGMNNSSAASSPTPTPTIFWPDKVSLRGHTVWCAVLPRLCYGREKGQHVRKAIVKPFRSNIAPFLAGEQCLGSPKGHKVRSC